MMRSVANNHCQVNIKSNEITDNLFIRQRQLTPKSETTVSKTGKRNLSKRRKPMAPWSFMRVNYLPMTLGVFFSAGLITCFVIAVLRGDVSPYMPFIRDGYMLTEH
ncbi:hypothetical protein TNCT_697731 [Trichonephila clavata]|uniref:Uncharacterized protein n=1 Tax=Trichonephila clavata TaxID=2740835 RepID=A0A8X6LQF8_TRICU|nr:hypothetical protein TNCT_697731 [Trichonephila clavata]